MNHTVSTEDYTAAIATIDLGSCQLSQLIQPHGIEVTPLLTDEWQFYN